jgi:phage FluMu protein Com
VKKLISGVKIKCPKCKEIAELSSDFAFVKCDHCNLDISYGEYVKYVAHNDVTYSDILGDYAASTEGQTAGTLDEWD